MNGRWGFWARSTWVLAPIALAVGAAIAGAQQHHHGGASGQHPGGHAGSQPVAGRAHQMPKGWKFTLPKGDPAKGREVFTKLECFKCHEVKGQAFPVPDDRENAGPELSEMGPHHDVEFFAESIVNPNAVIDEPKFRAADGSSRMPSFNDSITVQELVDLAAFLKSLSPPAGAAGGHKH